MEILKGFMLITPIFVAKEYLACVETESKPMVVPPEMATRMINFSQRILSYWSLFLHYETSNSQLFFFSKLA